MYPCNHADCPLLGIELIDLSNGKYAIVDSDDFVYLSRYKWRLAGDRVIATKWIKHLKKKRVLSISRFVMKLLFQHRPIVDHINHNTLDNRKCNLRICTYQQNNMNRRPKRNTSSKYKGVSKRKGRNKWRVHIFVNGKSECLGYFYDENEAAVAYNRRAIDAFGEYAYVNKIV